MNEAEVPGEHSGHTKKDDTKTGDKGRERDARRLSSSIRSDESGCSGKGEEGGTDGKAEQKSSELLEVGLWVWMLGLF